MSDDSLVLELWFSHCVDVGFGSSKVQKVQKIILPRTTGCFSYNCDTLSDWYDNNNDILAIKIYAYTHKKWTFFFVKKVFPDLDFLKKKSADFSCLLTFFQ